MQIKFVCVSRIFREHANWNISIIDVRENADKNYQADVDLFVIPATSHSLLTAQEVLEVVENNPTLLSELHRYGYIDAVCGNILLVDLCDVMH